MSLTDETWCGTPGGYHRHRRRGQHPCSACAEARRAALKEQRAAKQAGLTTKPKAPEEQRAIDALDKPGRDAVATTGDLEDGINMDRLHLKAERPEPPTWKQVFGLLDSYRESNLTTEGLTDVVMSLLTGGEAK